MMNGTLSFEDLQALTGYKRPGDVERCLKQQGVRIFWGKKGPWTTMHHLNNVGGQGYSPKPYDPITFE